MPLIRNWKRRRRKSAPSLYPSILKKSEKGERRGLDLIMFRKWPLTGLTILAIHEKKSSVVDPSKLEGEEKEKKRSRCLCELNDSFQDWEYIYSICWKWWCLRSEICVLHFRTHTSHEVDGQKTIAPLSLSHSFSTSLPLSLTHSPLLSHSKSVSPLLIYVILLPFFHLLMMSFSRVISHPRTSSFLSFLLFKALKIVGRILCEGVKSHCCWAAPEIRRKISRCNFITCTYSTQDSFPLIFLSFLTFFLFLSSFPFLFLSLSFILRGCKGIFFKRLI